MNRIKLNLYQWTKNVVQSSTVADRLHACSCLPKISKVSDDERRNSSMPMNISFLAFIKYPS